MVKKDFKTTLITSFILLLQIVSKSVWKINEKTVWKKQKKSIQNKIQNYEWNENNSTEYTVKIHTLFYETATKSLRKYKISNTILNGKQIQEAEMLKRKAKNKYQ